MTALLNSFRANIPIDNKQEIEDTFESVLCHSLLQKVDPSMATYLHSNDKRKVVNALFKRFKNLALSDEETIADQLQQRLALRFKPIILWIMADKAVLE